MTGNVLDTLKKIREGFLDPKEISISDRRVCVDYLRLEGYTQEDIAEIFKVHRQTIIREEKQKVIVHLCQESSASSISFNQGAWILGSEIATEFRSNWQITGWARNGDVTKLSPLARLPKINKRFTFICFFSTFAKCFAVTSVSLSS